MKITFSAALCLCFFFLDSGKLSGQSASYPEVDCKVTLKDMKPDWFEDNELDLPYYIIHFCKLANAVVAEGGHKGFIDLPVWRFAKDNKPYNARIMENIYSLAYFYATDRPWNPYYKDPGLKARIEAALQFWCSIQNEDGRFSEYRVKGWNLAATAFATKFMGEALRLLENAGTIDKSLMEKVLGAQRKAIMVTLQDDALYKHGKSFANQFTNVWPGTLAYLSMRNDPEVEQALHQKMQQSRRDFQSPAGYFYESDGPDWNYNLGTHTNNVMMTWPYVKGTKLEPLLRKEYEDFMGWVSLNALPEPGLKTWYLNGGISTRTTGYRMEESRNHFMQKIPIAEITPLAYPYLATKEDISAESGRLRASIANGTLQVDSLKIGEFHSYSPYGLLHRNVKYSFPAAAEKGKAVVRLPFLANRSFVEQRTDNRLKTTFTFIRRPGYYAIFNSGEVKNDRQTFGLGILWHPDAGTFIQPRVNHAEAAWGTSTEADGKKVFESESFYPDFHVNDTRLRNVPGIFRYPGGNVEVVYSLGDTGSKEVVFSENHISVKIRKPGNIVENIPFLHDCRIRIDESSGSCTIEKNGKELQLLTKGVGKMELHEVQPDPGAPIRRLLLRGTDIMEYQIVF